MTGSNDRGSRPPRGKQKVDSQETEKALDVSVKKKKKSRSKSVSDVNESDAWTCNGCQVTSIDENIQMMECDLCPGRYCIPCIGLTDEEYAALQALDKREDAIWLCPGCFANIGTMKTKHQSHEELERIKTDMNTKFETIEQQLSVLTKSLADSKSTQNTEFKRCFAEVLVGEKSADQHTQTKMKEAGVAGLVKNIVFEQRKEQQKELLEKEDREKNIVIFKSVEIEGEDLEERKKRDLTLTKKMMQEIERSDIEIKGMFRVGAFKAEENKTRKPRPLKICFHTKFDKESVMRNLYKLKESTEAEVKDIQVGHDLSRTERDMVKDKIEEAKNKGTETDFWAVRGPPWALRLVRLDRRQNNPM